MARCSPGCRIAPSYPAFGFLPTSVGGFGPEGFFHGQCQWRLDGIQLFGQTNNTLSITNAKPSDEGDYTVAVANALGEVVSGAARIYVTPPATNMIKSNYVDNRGLRLPYFFAKHQAGIGRIPG